MGPEAEIEQYMRNNARKLGYELIKFVSPSTRGVPDRILIGNGLVWFIELKSAVGRLSELQKQMHKKLKKLGVTVCTPKSKKETDEILADFAKAGARHIIASGSAQHENNILQIPEIVTKLKIMNETTGLTAEAHSLLRQAQQMLEYTYGILSGSQSDTKIT